MEVVVRVRLLPVPSPDGIVSAVRDRTPLDVNALKSLNLSCSMEVLLAAIRATPIKINYLRFSDLFG
jgi:hypothetical protein